MGMRNVKQVDGGGDCGIEEELLDPSRERPASPPARRDARRTKNQRRAFDEFVKVPIWWAHAAADAVGAPGVLVCTRLLHLAWKAGYKTFTVPNDWLEERGVSRRTKARLLRRLERAKLIEIDWHPGKAFRITVNVL
jgi:hypothetical protein